MHLTLTPLALLSVVLTGCGGSSSDSSAAGSGTITNTIESIRVTGSVSENATIMAQNGDITTPATDDDVADLAYDVTVDLDGTELPADPVSFELDWELNFASTVDADENIWYFRIESEE